MTISDNELRSILSSLESDCVDDPEELLNWFSCHGPSLIRELLRLRKGAYLIKQEVGTIEAGANVVGVRINRLG